jgi:hypothetical protein
MEADGVMMTLVKALIDSNNGIPIAELLSRR